MQVSAMLRRTGHARTTTRTRTSLTVTYYKFEVAAKPTIAIKQSESSTDVPNVSFKRLNDNCRLNVYKIKR